MIEIFKGKCILKSSSIKGSFLDPSLHPAPNKTPNRMNGEKNNNRESNAISATCLSIAPESNQWVSMLTLIYLVLKVITLSLAILSQIQSVLHGSKDLTLA